MFRMTIIAGSEREGREPQPELMKRVVPPLAWCGREQE